MQLNMKVEVPDRLRKFLANPTPYVNQTMQGADKEALTLLKTDIAAKAPKKSGKLAASITVDIANRKLFSPLVYARAIELGHYAVPKGKYLHFVDRGKDVFLKFTRSRKQPFFFKTLHADKIKILDIYDKAFKRLLESI